MAQAEQESDLRDEMALKLSSQGLVLLGLANELDGDISLLVNASIDPAMPTGGEFASNVELRQIGAPFFFSVALDLRAGRYQVLRPRLRSIVLPQRQPPPAVSTAAIARNLLQPVQALHGSVTKTKLDVGLSRISKKVVVI